MTTQRPPSIDALARQLANSSALPHGLLVRCARLAVSGAGSVDEIPTVALRLVHDIELSLVQPVINATGVLLHTNLGRAPLAPRHFLLEGNDPSGFRSTTLEFQLGSGTRGSRHTGVATLISELTGAEDAVVVNNNAAAVLLVLAATSQGRDVAISRGESVEIGGGFRIPEVLEQSGARLVDVGTTNRTRVSDYANAIAKKGNDIATIMRVHPSNFHIDGFTEQAPLAELAGLGVPVISDIGSGLIDANCPWLPGAPPQWLSQEPAARQALEEGAALVTFSGDKLLGGPQCGIIAGRADLVAACKRHPLMRALRPGSHVLIALQHVLLSFAARTAVHDIPFWSMATAPLNDIRQRAERLAHDTGAQVVSSTAVPGAGSTPGAEIGSFAVSLRGDHTAQLRRHRVPVVARTESNATLLDLRSVSPADDAELGVALRQLSEKS